MVLWQCDVWKLRQRGNIRWRCYILLRQGHLGLRSSRCDRLVLLLTGKGLKAAEKEEDHSEYYQCSGHKTTKTQDPKYPTE